MFVAYIDDGMRSTTPPGEPPHLHHVPTSQTYHDQYLAQQQQQQQQAQAQQQQQQLAAQQAQQQANAASTASLLQALANMSKTTKPSQAPVLTPPQPQQQHNPPASIVSPPQAPAISVLPTQAQQLNGLPSNLAALLPPNLGGMQQPPQQQHPGQPQASQFPPAMMQQPNVGVDPTQMALLQLLLQQPGFQGLANLPVAQLAPALGPLLGGLAQGQAGLPAWQQQMSQQPQQQPSQTENRFDDRNPRERGRYSPGPRSPYRRRSRSRSPGYNRRESPPAFRRRSPTYDDYGNENPPRAGSRDPEFAHGGRGRGRGGHGRRGSPDRRRRDRSGSPPGRNQRNGGRSGDTRFDAPDIPAGPKLVEHDSSLPKDHIKVYSRTLFVGGVA